MIPTSLLVPITLLLSHLVSRSNGFLVPGLSVRCRSCGSLQSSPMEETELQSTSLKVGIIGAGSIAFGTASLLSSLGHDPMLWSLSGAGTKELIEEAHQASATKNDVQTSKTKITATGAHQLMEQASDKATTISKIQSTGALSQVFNVRIARSTKELVRSNDNILVVALPVNCHKNVMDRFAPEIIEWMKESKKLMRIIISSHASLGAVYLMQLLRKEWLSKESTSLSDFENNIRISCWGTTAITARKTGGTSVNVLTIRKEVDYCTVPFKSEDDTNDILQTLFGPRFRYREGGLLAISLSNLNPQNHLGIVLGNMSRMDPPPPPPPLNDMPVIDTKVEPWYQGKSITPKVGRLMEALDLERIKIAKELKIDVRTIYEHFSWSFHVPLETPIDKHAQNCEAGETSMRPLTVSEMNQQMHYYKKNDVLGPTNPESRYVMEDVPYGLVLTVILGRLLNCPARLHESGIMILSAMYDRDFMVENELLQGLGLIADNELNVNAYTLQEWKEMAYLGYFRER